MTWEERRLFLNRIYWLFIILKILSTIWWMLKCFPRGKQNIFLFGRYCIYFFVGKVPNPMNILITNTDQLARELEFLCINKHNDGSWNSSNYFIFGIAKLLKRGRRISSDECVSPLSALSVLALFPIRTLTPLRPMGGTPVVPPQEQWSGAELKSTRLAHTDLPRRLHYTLV